MITPHILTRIEQYTGTVIPTTSDKGISLIKQVKMLLFNPQQYVKLLNTSDFYANRFLCDNIVHVIQNHPLIKNVPLLENSYQHWTEPRYDLACSSKIDYLSNTGIIDIRLTSCTTLSEFILQCYAYKYNRVAAFVSDGLQKENYIIIGINKKKYKTFTINFKDSEPIAEGRTDYEELIDKLLLFDEITRDAILETTF